MSRLQNRFLAALLATICMVPVLFAAQKRGSGESSDHWVTTWATAQQLLAVNFGRPDRGAAGPSQSADAAAPRSTTTRADGRQGFRGPAAPNLPSSFANQTLRMIARVSLGGRRIRITLSNMLNAQPVEIGSVHVAIHAGGGAIVEGTDRALTFGGKKSFTIPPGVLAVSDPVALDVAPLSDLAISLYLPSDTGTPTTHMLGLRTTYVSKGEVTSSVAMPDPVTMTSYFWLSSIEVAAPPEAFTIVALGDSITDGFATTRDAERAWPSLLARRLQANKSTRHIAVVNQGISGNQLLRDGAGLSALGRLDRDVLSRPGVKWVILLEGINDINIRGRTEGPNALTAEDLIWAYRQIVARCHAHGIKVIGATIMPQEGVPVATQRGEEIRQEVNRWIRTKGNFDAVVDFDAATRDAGNPARLRPEFDPGDHIHPNDAGNQVMADTIDINAFRK